jgi:hypothetical protein
MGWIIKVFKKTNNPFGLVKHTKAEYREILHKIAVLYPIYNLLISHKFS